MTETNWTEYDALFREAAKDNRVGKLEFMVTSVTDGTWPSGDTYKKIKGNLIAAGNAITDFNLSPLKSAKEIAALKGIDMAKFRGETQQAAFHKHLAQYYSKSVDTLKVGDVLFVQTRKDKNGFIRVQEILDPRLAKAQATVKADKDPIPF